MKKIVLLLLTSIVLFAQSQSSGVFSRLPYGMKFDEPIPPKVEKKIVFKDYQYQVPGKFSVKFDPDSKKLEGIYFSYADYDVPVLLPKRWRRVGLKMCYIDEDGASFDRVLKAVKENGAFDIEIHEDQYRKILTFNVDNDKKYEMIFFTHAEKNEHGSGLAYITITKQEDNADDDEDY